MPSIKDTVQICAFFLLITGITACSDSPTEVSEPDPPELPELQSYQPDTDYFKSSSSQKTTQAQTSFEFAAQLMQFTVEPLFSTSNIYMPFFSQASGADPTFNDGIWEWSYSYSQFEQSAEIRLTAEPENSASEFSWNLFISSSTTQGPSFDDYRFMDGTSASDGSEGQWSIYPYEPEGSGSAMLTFDWTREDENNYTASYNINGPEASATFTINYTKADDEHTLDLSSSDGEYDVVVFWNSDTGTGYINQASSEKLCWDAQHNTVPCQ